MQRKINLDNIELLAGKHEEGSNQFCIMELVSYIAREPWSDHPVCACPVLTSYAIGLNDRFNNDHRQLLKPFIPLLIGTRSTEEVELARRQLMRWRYVTAAYPLILDVRKLPDLATKLRTFQNTPEDMKAAKELLAGNSAKLRAADAYAYAYDANAYADADALQLKLAEVAIETLRMMIEVKI